MCEFCTQHGEGKKWYLTMENYSIELLDQNERRKYAAEFLNGFHTRVPRSLKQLDKIRKTLHISVKSHTEIGPCRTVRGEKNAVVGIVP
jgi:hypothetical protein